MSMCNSCRYGNRVKKLNADLKRYLQTRIQVIAVRAKQQGIVFTLTSSDLKDQFERQNGLCFYTDIPLRCELGKGKQSDGLSVDRVAGDKGYTKDNFVLCTNKANT
jgi:hypothetical protein